MPRKSPYNDDYGYDEQDDRHYGARKFKKEKPEPHEKRKPWDRENQHSRHDDYDERH